MAEENNKPLNVAENLVSDKGTMTVSTKLMKYAVGTLIGGTISILMFAYGLYWTAEDHRKEADKKITEQMVVDKQDILAAIEELEKEEVKPNTEKNYTQDMNIMLVMERTNTLGQRINGNSQRPPSVDAHPMSAERVEVEVIPLTSFLLQNVVQDTAVKDTL